MVQRNSRDQPEAYVTILRKFLKWGLQRMFRKSEFRIRMTKTNAHIRLLSCPTISIPDYVLLFRVSAFNDSIQRFNGSTLLTPALIWGRNLLAFKCHGPII
jgi:hypothetical protein